jgi:hypothetical protein
MLKNHCLLTTWPPHDTSWLRLKLDRPTKIAMCDVALVSRRTGAVDRDAVCGLLTECLQDVGSVLLTLYFSCLLLNF